jgi:MarR family transcriptional regulator, transcriptional regulator for hemolysin
MEKQNLSLLELGKMMHSVYRVFKRRFEAQIQEEVKISIEQLSLLHAISKESEEVIQKDMAEMMGKDKSAILRLIDMLEEKELVRRVTDSKDRRKNYLMVTKVGNRVLEQYMKIVQNLMQELQTGLAQSEIDTFHKVTLHIKSAAEKL